MLKALKTLWIQLEKEYILGLTKWRDSTDKYYQPLKDGDFVYIISTQGQVPSQAKTFPGRQQSLLGRYRVGRIFQVQPGPDGVDRVFYVKHGPTIGGKLQLTRMSSMNVVPVVDPSMGM